MFDIITGVLPFHLNIKGIDYKINPFFKSILKIEKIFNLKDITPLETAMQICAIFFKEQVNFFDTAFINAFVDFYSIKDKLKYNETKSDKILLNFFLDADFIYCDFLREYNINLQKETELHYYEFISLLQGLSKDSETKNIMSIRDIDLMDIKDDKLKQNYARLQYKYSLNPVSDLDKNLKTIFEECKKTGDYRKYLEAKNKGRVYNGGR